jgi:hypothetical protein
MLSPLSLAGLSIGSDFLKPIRAMSPSLGAAQGTTSPGGSRSLSPLSPMPLGMPNDGAPEDGGGSSRPLPRGSLLDLSV